MRGQQGTALILVIVVLAALSFLGVIGSRSALTELQMTRQDVLSKQALGVGEAGLNHAYELLVASGGFSNELAGGGTGGTLAGIGSVATLDGASYRFRAFGGGASRIRASLTRKSAPRHSCRSGSTPDAPRIETASATSAVASRALARAASSSACAVSPPGGGCRPTTCSDET